MFLKGLLFAALALCVSHVAALSLANSNWIWTDSNYMNVAPFVTRDFRRSFTSPRGKTAVSSQILIAADNRYTLLVNGKRIGVGSDWTQSQQYCARLKPKSNVFAVTVENQPYNPGDATPNPAAFIAAIQINYSDGTSHTVITDAKWLGNNGAGWRNAYVAGPATSRPWHVPAAPPAPVPSALALNDSYWVWTNEVPPSSPMSDAPYGARAFRKKIYLGRGSTVRTGTIIMDADNEYDLYINGKYIGSGNNWQTAQRWRFTHNGASVVIAVKATNRGYQAGIIAAIALDTADQSCYSSNATPYYTDGTWKYAPNNDVPAGFEQPGFNDRSWKNVVEEGRFGVQPWGQVAVQNAN